MDRNVVPSGNPDESNILLVDDNPITLEQMATLLEERGYLVTCSTTVFEALILIREYPHLYDIVMADLLFPGMSKIEATISANSLSPNTPVRLYIDKNDYIDEKRTAKMGITEIANKLSKIDELDSIIKRAINK